LRIGIGKERNAFIAKESSLLRRTNFQIDNFVETTLARASHPKARHPALKCSLNQIIAGVGASLELDLIERRDGLTSTAQFQTAQ
jgi:hypothetical protein